MEAHVGIVIVHFGRWDFTRRCVASIKASTHTNFRIEVVDNDKENRGFAAGANAGIGAVLRDRQVEYVLLLNNDAWLEREALLEMVAAAQAHEADMVAPVVKKARDGSLESAGLALSLSWLAFNKAKFTRQEPFSPSGCAALYSRRLIEDISRGGQFFDEDFFMYGEDTDVGLRARAHGYRCALAGEATVWHEGSASVPDASLPMYLGHRNNVWYIAKNISARDWYQWPAILAGQVASLVWLTLRGDGKIIWKAKYDALRGLPRMWRKRRLTQT